MHFYSQAKGKNGTASLRVWIDINTQRLAMPVVIDDVKSTTGENLEQYVNSYAAPKSTLGF